jgi:hypothetical protein
MNLLMISTQHLKDGGGIFQEKNQLKNQQVKNQQVKNHQTKKHQKHHLIHLIKLVW